MNNWWPSGMNAKDYSPEDRAAIKIHERIRQLEDRVAELEVKK